MTTRQPDRPTISRIVSILLTAAIALAAVFGYDILVERPRGGPGESGGLPTMERDTSHFSGLNVSGAADFDSTLNVDGATTLAGGLALGRGLILSSTTITPTGGQTITPIYDVYVIGATGAVSMTLAACSTTAQVVTFVGEDNYNITVNDVNVYTHDGNAEVFGQFDVSQWICIGTKWHQFGLTSADS